MVLIYIYVYTIDSSFKMHIELLNLLINFTLFNESFKADASFAKVRFFFPKVNIKVKYLRLLKTKKARLLIQINTAIA